MKPTTGTRTLPPTDASDVFGGTSGGDGIRLVAVMLGVAVGTCLLFTPRRRRTPSSGRSRNPPRTKPRSNDRGSVARPLIRAAAAAAGALATMTAVAVGIGRAGPAAAAVVERRLNRVHQRGPYRASARAVELHRTLTVVDLHADSLLWGRDLRRRAGYGHVDIPRLIEGGIALIALAASTKVPVRPNLVRNDDTAMPSR